MSMRSQGTGPSVRIRHIPYTAASDDSFGDHYITVDPSLATAGQFDITVFPCGDRNLPAGDPMRGTPHVRVRTLASGNDWQVLSRTPVANDRYARTTPEWVRDEIARRQAAIADIVRVSKLPPA